jgi:uncharacterized protein YjbI with pentapeptide repeats
MLIWVWAATGAAFLFILLLSVLIFPTMLVRHDLGRRVAQLTPDQLAKATNDARTTLLQGLGGLAVFAGAVVAYRQLTTGREQLRVAQEGQITERFTRAVSQLGDDKSLDIRLGGIYALERIANDSPVDRAAIAEILTAYVRGHSPWPPSRRWQPPPDTAIVDLQPLRLRAPAVQACMTVLARSTLGWGVPRLDLGDADLRKADLADANLQEAILAGTHLEGANLDRVHLDAAHLERACLEEATLHSAHLPRAFLASARLREANLNSAHLQGAYCAEADLQEAILDGVELQQANLQAANLQEAILPSARLDGANLAKAQLERAWLHFAHLEGANLRRARLHQADLHEAHLQQADLSLADLQGANLAGANLQGAKADEMTVWPNEFDPLAAGVVLEDEPRDQQPDGSA